MTREEAIQWLKHINITDFGWDDYAMQDSQKEIRERCEQSIREAIDMAIEALSADTVSREAHYDALANRITDMEERGFMSVVRCKECRWFKQDSSPVGYGYCNGRMVGEVDYNDYCSFGELADKTKYPATYNTNTKCGGCVHLDELGRCLSFMTAKDDRSCWRGSWENNNGELAEQTALSAEPIERISENTIVVKYADYEDIGRIILTNGDIFCKMFYEDARQNDDSDYDSLVPDEYKTEPSDLISRADAESDDIIIKGAKGIQDGLYHIKDGKLFKYKANGGTVRNYPIVPSAEPTEDYSDLPDIPRAYYERIVGNMSHEINMLKQQLDDRPSGEWVNEWKDIDGGRMYGACCSVCHTIGHSGYNYCPSCGARMENKK